MKAYVVIQARMGSERFPGKVLFLIEGKPVLQYLLERVKNCSSLEDIIVATSTEKEDSAIADFCDKYGVSCYRGSLSDVASRFKELSEKHPLDCFVRLSADSPLLDQQIINKAIDIFKQGNFDIVTNIQKRTYPKGQSVEVLRNSTFQSNYGLMQEPEDLEHVTKYFYKNPHNFKIYNFALDRDCSDVRLALDTPRDLEVITSLIQRMKKPHWQYGLDEILQIYYELS